jgi:hypothetical protein
VSDNNRFIQKLNLNNFQLGERVASLEHEKQSASNEHERVASQLRLQLREAENCLKLIREEHLALQQHS